jgi:NAD(P)-dependent dehydrogenase (short-subunit alcohol dehydrogenase family)
VDLGLEGSVAFITGGSQGIGKATAHLLASLGCDVAIVARRRELLDSVASDLSKVTGRRVIGFSGDMSIDADVRAAVDEALNAFGRIDVCVPCAGSSPGGLLDELTDEQWHESLNLKFMGHVRTTRAVIPHMQKRGKGSVVVVNGNDGLKASYWEITAGAANAANVNFFSSIAEQYAPYGIRINTVNPGPVSTQRWDRLEKAFARDKGISQEDAHKHALRSLPLGRICTPEEVANVVAFLASDRASYVTGAHVLVDGAQRKSIMDT